MQSELEIISKELLEKQLSIIPLEYRNQFIRIIKETEENIKHKLYHSEVGDGALKIKIESDGTLKDFEISKQILEEYSDPIKLNKVIKDLFLAAYSEATNKAKKDITTQVKSLQSKITLLSKELIRNVNESNSR